MSNKPEITLKQFPTFTSDEEVERFVDQVDLSEFDFSGFKPMPVKLDNASHKSFGSKPKSNT